MQRQGIEFQKVSFTYETMDSPLVEELSLHFPTGWTGIVGANGAGKTTILRLATGGLHAQSGRIHIPGAAIYCQQRTDDAPEMLEDLLDSTDGEACEIKGRLGIDDDWPHRWATLSHGERKRAQVAVALWRQPGVLAIDEPTNHLDAQARELLAAALPLFRGVGLLVSHDRELLDSLCGQCLFVDPPDAVMRPGGFSQGMEQAEMDQERARDEYRNADRTYAKLRKEAAKRRNAAARSHRMRSKRGIPIKDHDARHKKNLARLTGKDGKAGKLLNQMKGRVEQAKDQRDGIKLKRRYETGIWLPGSQSKRNALFSLPAGTIPLGGGKSLAFPDLVMRPDDRIALTGVNGSGKSTLVRHLVKGLSLPPERLIYLPQEIDLAASRAIMDRARSLPGEKLGTMMSVVSRLGSRPKRLLGSAEPSPGEIRKLVLATGIANSPHLIVMDEPTNHLDLPSIEALEKALSDCPCGLLLVSHDRRFLEALTQTRWHITENGDDSSSFELRVL